MPYILTCVDHHHIDTVFIYKGKKGAEEPSAPARVRREPASDVNAGTCLNFALHLPAMPYILTCVDYHHVDTVFIYIGNKGAEEPSAPARVRREPASDVNAGTCLTFA